MSTTTIGWLGTGRMGFELALRLCNAGHELRVWNRTRAKAEPLAELGATIVDTVAELADCDVVFTIVSNSAVFEDVVLGAEGLLSVDGVAPGVIVDASTISVEASETVAAAAAARGSALLSAPVSGNPNVVRAGRLAVVVSGPRAAYDQAAALLDVFGASVTYVGEGHTARLVKICHNLVLGVVTQVLAETTVLAEKAGIARADYLAFLNGSVAGSVYSRYKTPALVHLDFAPTFTGHLLRKDLELGLAAAREHDVAMPISAQVHQQVVSLIGNGLGDVDFAALLELTARAAGLDLVAEDRDDVDDGLTPVDDLSSRRPQG